MFRLQNSGLRIWDSIGFHRGYMGIREKKMERTWRGLGFRANNSGLGFRA